MFTMTQNQNATLYENMIDVMMQLDESVVTSFMEVKKKIDAVKNLIQPYVHDSEKIIYYCASKGYYKCRVPVALRRQDTKPPVTAKSEIELWLRLYSYFEDRFAKKQICDIYDLWIAEREADVDVSSETVKRDRQRFDKHIRNHTFAHRSIDTITPKDIKDFLKSVTSGRQITRRELGAIKSLLIGIFTYAVDHGVITVNPVLQVNTKNLKCKPVNNSRKVYTEHERRMLLDHLATQPQTGYTLAIAFMFNADARIGEIKALHWYDIDFANRTVDIYREAVLRKDTDNKTRLQIVEHTKTEDGSRTQPLSKTAIAILQTTAALNSDHKPDDLIFTNAAGGILDTNKLNRVLRRSCDAAGIRYYSSHKIRFYAVSAMAKAGYDIGTIMYNSGHKCKSTTLHYIRHAQTETTNAEK